MFIGRQRLPAVITAIKSMRGHDSRLRTSIIYSLAAKFIGVAVTIFVIPAASSYLSADSFGIWMFITGLLASLSFLDLGVGIGLQNGLSKSSGIDSLGLARQYLASSYTLVLLITAALALVLTVAYSLREFIPFMRNSPNSDEILQSILIACLIYILGIPFGLIHRVLNGMQRYDLTNLLIICGSLLSLLSVYVAAHLGCGLTGMLIAFILPPITANAFYSLYYFNRICSFRLAVSIDRRVSGDLIRAGGWSLAAQLLYTIKVNAPPALIALISGAAAVGEFSVVYKVVSIVGLLLAVSMQPLWSAYGEAYYRSDISWIKKAIKRSIFVSLTLSIVSGIFFFLFGEKVISWWAPNVVIPSGMISAVAVWSLLTNINVCFAMFLNGISAFRRQTIVAALTTGLAVLAAYLTGAHSGVVALIVAFVFFADFMRALFLAYDTRRLLM